MGRLKIDDVLSSFIKDANYIGIFFLDRLPFYNKDNARLEEQSFAKTIHKTLFYFYQKLNIPIYRVRFFHGDAGIEKRVDFILEKSKLI